MSFQLAIVNDTAPKGNNIFSNILVAVVTVQLFRVRI